MEVKERIAYVRGLIEGSDAFQRDQATRTLWENLLAICDGLADSVKALQSAQGEIEEYVEGIDADLGDLEEEVYGRDEDEDDEEIFGDEMVRAECPRCGEEALFEEGLLYDDHVEISCPECGELLFRGGEHTLEFSDDEEEESTLNGNMAAPREESAVSDSAR